MPFSILNLSTNRPYCIPGTNMAATFETGEAAALQAKELAAATGDKHQPRRVADSEWRRRECRRLVDGTYQKVPWWYEEWFKTHYNVDHYLHVSIEKGGYVAFTDSEDKGAADRQTRMRAGSYLKRFFNEVLTDEEIARLATELAADTEDNEIMFATTATEIERVYLHGPSSCMSHGLDHYQSSIHPVRFYAAGDLAVAYLKRTSDDITARSVVWPEKKIFTRIYGDEIRLKALLKQAGYVSGDLDGARLLKIKEGRGYVCPYIDSTDYFDVEKEYLILRNDGDISCNDGEPTGIWPKQELSTCDQCDEQVDEDDLYTVQISYRLTANWCGCCRENTTFCAEEGVSVPDDEVVDMANGDYWSSWKFAEDGATCERSDDNIPSCETVKVNTRCGIENWSERSRERYATKCEVTNNWYADDAIVKLPDGRDVGFDTEEAESIDLSASISKPSPIIEHSDQKTTTLTR